MNIAELKSILDRLDLNMRDHVGSLISQEIDNLSQSTGKKFRPALLYLLGDLFGLTEERLTPFARVVELTHFASLVHDDVIDKSDLRRNAPTLNSKYPNTVSILAGDFVLATVMKELAEINETEILYDLSSCIQDLAVGEWLQNALKDKEDVSQDDLKEVAFMKTGSLIRWSLTTPGKLSKFEDIKTLSDIGNKIGLIFQMADDIVDSIETSGKPAFLDIRNGQINFVTQKLCDLYPNLKDKVNALRTNDSLDIPWTKEEYNEAIKKIDEEITEEKNLILNHIKNLCIKNNKNEHYLLFELMVNRIQEPYLKEITL